MSWTTVEPRDPEELRIARERGRIRDSIPIGWESRHIRLEYDVDPASVGVGGRYGICGHDRICLLTSHWLHPFPYSPRVCDQPPKMVHTGVC